MSKFDEEEFADIKRRLEERAAAARDAEGRATDRLAGAKLGELDERKRADEINAALRDAVESIHRTGGVAQRVDIEKARAIITAAPAGPYTVHRCNNHPAENQACAIRSPAYKWDDCGDLASSDAYDECSHPIDRAFAEFAVAARVGWPAALDEIVRLRALLEVADRELAAASVRVVGEDLALGVKRPDDR